MNVAARNLLTADQSPSLPDGTEPSRLIPGGLGLFRSKPIPTTRIIDRVAEPIRNMSEQEHDQTAAESPGQVTSVDEHGRWRGPAGRRESRTPTAAEVRHC
jgi:hypothetical protein